MTVTKVRPDGLRDLSFEFLSGPDHIAFPAAEGYRGNPVAVQFLERDIRDMALATGRSTDYFRNRIRKAFRDPQIETTQATVDNTTVDAVAIEVRPFQADPNLVSFDGYAGKEYHFLYSEQVPGDLIDIRTRMSGKTGEALEEELRYRRMTDAQ